MPFIPNTLDCKAEKSRTSSSVLSLISKGITSIPFSSNNRFRADPMKPELPVIKIFVVVINSLDIN